MAMTGKAGMYFNETHDAFRESVRRFVDREINPFMDEWEESGVPLHPLLKKMGTLASWGSATIRSMGARDSTTGLTPCFWRNSGISTGWGCQPPSWFRPIWPPRPSTCFGSPWLKEKYLKPAIAGDVVTALAVTDPERGRTSSPREQSGQKRGSLCAEGSKTYITNGTQADFLTLLAKTSDESGYHSFSLFVVPTDLPGFVISKKLDKLGLRSSDTAELFFDDVRIPVENLIGEEGEGFIYQMKQFQHERFATLPARMSASRT